GTHHQICAQRAIDAAGRELDCNRFDASGGRYRLRRLLGVVQRQGASRARIDEQDAKVVRANFEGRAVNRRDDRGRGSTKAYVVHAGGWSAAVAAIRPQFGGTYDIE